MQKVRGTTVQVHAGERKWRLEKGVEGGQRRRARKEEQNKSITAFLRHTKPSHQSLGY